jgi:hypothetical protein
MSIHIASTTLRVRQFVSVLPLRELYVDAVSTLRKLKRKSKGILEMVSESTAPLGGSPLPIAPPLQQHQEYRQKEEEKK